MRRLPVYLLLDTSGSMTGDPIEAVKSGLQMLIASLRQDPYALETAYISVITFSSDAKQIVPLTELSQFQAPNIEAAGTTAMGESLALLADCVQREVKKGTADQKGDWKPVVFMLSDGSPTDDLEKGIVALRTIRTGAFVCCAAGQSADTTALKRSPKSWSTLTPPTAPPSRASSSGCHRPFRCPARRLNRARRRSPVWKICRRPRRKSMSSCKEGERKWLFR